MLTGDAANTDPACSKSPLHHIMTDAVAAACAPERLSEPLVMRRRTDHRKTV